MLRCSLIAENGLQAVRGDADSLLPEDDRLDVDYTAAFDEAFGPTGSMPAFGMLTRSQQHDPSQLSPPLPDEAGPLDFPACMSAHDAVTSPRKRRKLAVEASPPLQDRRAKPLVPR